MTEKEVITICCDHAGFHLKQHIIKELNKRSIIHRDLGTLSPEEPSDSVILASKIARAISNGSCNRGIAVGGTGLGMSIVSNRFPQVRSALCINTEMARTARAHDDSNMLVLAARFTKEKEAAEIMDVWLNTAFEGGFYLKRVRLIDDPTRLHISFSHISQIDPDKIVAEEVNQNFMDKAIKILHKVKNLFPEDRRGNHENRLTEYCPTKFSYMGDAFVAEMTDLSSGGAQFKIHESGNVREIIVDDEIEFEIKTLYGVSSCKGRVRWMDAERATVGISFTSFPSDPKDPLQLLLGSM